MSDSTKGAPDSTTLARRPNGTFQKGTSGNRAGMPRGTLNKKSRARDEVFLQHAAKAARNVVRKIDHPDEYVSLQASRMVLEGAERAAARLPVDEQVDASYFTLDEMRTLHELVQRNLERQRLGIRPDLRPIVDVQATVADPSFEEPR
jgi:hypothetical protein